MTLFIAGMGNSRIKMYRFNNITFTFPPSPLLTQPDDIPMNIMCNENNIPTKCSGKSVCECVHIIHIPMGSTVEIILFDQGKWICLVWIYLKTLTNNKIDIT